MSLLLLALTNTANFLFIFFIYPNIYIGFKYFGISIFLIQVMIHLYTMLINPGIPNKNNYISENVLQIIYMNMKMSGMTFDKYRTCKICNILVNKEDGVIHCDDCNICVKGNFFIICYKIWIIIAFGLGSVLVEII